MLMCHKSNGSGNDLVQIKHASYLDLPGWIVGLDNKAFPGQR